MDQPHCSTNLPLVDAAFQKPGGDEARELKTRYCPGCPVLESCLHTAMTSRQWGVWGATTPKVRTAHGAPRVSHA